jgi:hypothetical protein
MAKQPKSQPMYLKGTKPVHIPVHRVVDVLKMIDEHGHSKKFSEQAKEKDLVMGLHPDTVNFVKDFVADNDLHEHPVGKQVINSKGTYDCTSG